MSVILFVLTIIFAWAGGFGVGYSTGNSSGYKLGLKVGRSDVKVEKLLREKEG
jgi:hypothetical protein